MRVGIATIVLFILGSTALTLSDTESNAKPLNRNPRISTEPQAILLKNGEIDHTDPPGHNDSLPSFSPFSQMMVDEFIDTDAVCAEYDGLDEGRVKWHNRFVKAECDDDEPRVYKVTCYATYKLPNSYTHGGDYGEKVYPRPCPRGKFCKQVTLLGKGDEGPRTDIMCSDTKQIRVEEVSASTSKSHGAEEDVHCSLTLALPGSQYRAAPSGHQFDLIMTEEVFYPNGSAYPAPVLFIRDKTSRYGYDRVLRQRASVASTSVTFESVRGKIQPRLYEFCMQMMPGRPHAWVTFMYSWTFVAHRRGRVYKELDAIKVTE